MLTVPAFCPLQADLRRQLDSAHADIILLNNRCKETASRAVGFKDLEAQVWPHVFFPNLSWNIGQCTGVHATRTLVMRTCGRETLNPCVPLPFEYPLLQIRILQAELEAKDLQLEQYEEAEKRRQQADTQEQNTTLLLESYQQVCCWFVRALNVHAFSVGRIRHCAHTYTGTTHTR